MPDWRNTSLVASARFQQRWSHFCMWIHPPSSMVQPCNPSLSCLQKAFQGLSRASPRIWHALMDFQAVWFRILCSKESVLWTSLEWRPKAFMWARMSLCHHQTIWARSKWHGPHLLDTWPGVVGLSHMDHPSLGILLNKSMILGKLLGTLQRLV